MNENSHCEKKFIQFSQRGDLWNDIIPVPQFSGNIEILNIEYPPHYQEVMSYFRAIILNNEISKRAYDLTTEVIMLNASNYMSWYHRRLCIDNIDTIDLEEELNWVDSINVENQKNYQIWHHRKVIVEKLNNPSHEKPLLGLVFEDEPKNFHAWCHRIWVVRRFCLYEGEMEFIEKMLEEDIRNNSAWNYRFFLVNHLNEKDDLTFITSEIMYALDKIKVCPNNESPFSYIRGFLGGKNNKYSYADFPQIQASLLELTEQSKEYAHVWSMLLDCYEMQNNKDRCIEIINILIEIDYMRKKYWGWRKENLIKLNQTN